MARSRKKAATIKDIARECGVSITTVSRVLSGSDYPVSETFRKKVLKAAKTLNYQPNLFARALKTNRSKEIGVIITSITNPFYTSLVSGIEDMLGRQGYNIILYDLHNNLKNLERIAKSVAGKRMDGLILSTAGENLSLVQELKTACARMIMVDYMVPGMDLSSIYFDYHKGSMLEVEYLIQKGHTKIAYAGLEPDSRSRADRLDGFRMALRANNLLPDEEHIYLLDSVETTGGNAEFMAGIKLGGQIAEAKAGISAVVAVNDMVAFGLIHYFNANGIKVPGDISVVGFDDNTFSEICYPPLTTIRVPASSMGEMAAKMLIEEIEQEKSQTINLVMEPVLVERATVSEKN